MSLSLCLYQPDIPQNVGSAIRLCACLGIDLHIIEPCGFPWDEKKIRISAMDYYDHLSIIRHSSWKRFQNIKDKRKILLTTKSSDAYTKFHFQQDDILILGRESAGVPENIHNDTDHRITIPMAGTMRSINVINAGAMVMGEALRQLT